jgi:hypothetical protein
MIYSADKLPAPPIDDPTPEGAKRLFMQVICQAVEDHGVPVWRDEVDAFFSGPAFARYCGLLGWNDEWARRRIQRLVAPRPPAREGETRPAQYES